MPRARAPSACPAQGSRVAALQAVAPRQIETVVGSHAVATERLDPPFDFPPIQLQAWAYNEALVFDDTTAAAWVACPSTCCCRLLHSSGRSSASGSATRS